jgi:hypothetical protein
VTGTTLTSPFRCIVLALLAIALTLTASRSFADEEAARQHFKRGIGLYDKKQYSEALVEFEEAYKQKPSAGIKQNVALCLKAMNKPAEAAASFDEALDEGKGPLKPETRAAIERELTELSKVVATVNIAVLSEDRRPVESYSISVEPAGQQARTLPPEANKRPIRLMPGLYTFSAHVPGHPDPPEKKLALVSGPPVDATFVLGERGTVNPGSPGQQGKLMIKASRAEATIRVDGVIVGRETWTGTIASGPHHIDVEAPGWKTSATDLNLTAGTSVELPVTLLAMSEAPGEYMANLHPAPKRKRYYVVIEAALDGVGYHLSPALGLPGPDGERHGFGGAALGGRFGYAFQRYLAVELGTQLGLLGAKYHLHPADTVDTDTTVFHWQLAPSLRFMTAGKVRLTGAFGLGIHGLALSQKAPTVTTKGSGVAFAGLFDLGAQFDIGPVFLETVLFLDVHGVGPVKGDDPPEARLLLDSPAARGGLRLGLGIPF